MFKRLIKTLLVGLAVAAAVHSVQAGSVLIPGTANAKLMLGTNDRGDILWSTNAGVGLTLSTRDAAGNYSHNVIDATVAGKGWDYSNLANNGDAAWLGSEPATSVKNIYHYDAITRTVRPLTFYTVANPGSVNGSPKVGGNGSTAWTTVGACAPSCGSFNNFLLDYFDKRTSQTIRLSATVVDPNRIALNGRDDAYWFERAADGALELRMFNALTHVTKTITRRLAATLDFSEPITVNDFGNVVWTEVINGLNNTDVFMFNQRTDNVRQITNTPGRKHDTRINASGDIAWMTESAVWLYDQRSENAVLISAFSRWGAGLALNDMGEVAWTNNPNEIYPEMHLYKRATAVDVRVRPEFYNPAEGGAKLSGSGDLFFFSGREPGGIGIVRSTRNFTCN